MKRFFNNDVSLLIADILIFFTCVGGLYLITLKADLPLLTSFINSKLIVSENLKTHKNINEGDEILSIDNLHFSRWEELELYLDRKYIGDTVQLQLNSNGVIKSETVQLKKYYSLFDLIIISLVSLVFIVLGVFVRIKASDNYSAHIFHWASVGLGMVIVMTAGFYNIQPFGYGHFNRIIWLLAYSVTPVLFIHFTASFSKKKIKGIKYVLRFFYIIAVVNTLILTYLFLDATLNENVNSLKSYVAFFDSFFRIFLITCIVLAISICIYAYRSTVEIEERKRLQWLLLGFFIGPFSFAIFWVIPIYFFGQSLIPESLMLIFLTAIPITFSIAIIKYHLMDINLIIRRSVVYTIILGAIILTYIAISSVITLFVKDINPAFPSVLTAFAVVVLLQPAKTGVQKFVDKKFFRVEYDYREEQKRFLDDIKNIYDVQSLAEMIVERVDNLIPVEKLGYFELNNLNGRVRIIANKGWDLLRGRSIRFESENLKTDMSLPVAVDDKVEPGLKIESADVKVFRRWGMVLVLPVKSPTGIFHAFLVLGAKKSGTRFVKDDIDLLNSVVTASALAIDRIKLQEELLLEQLEAQRLKELDEMRKDFINTMTHELKTPLTNIKMFTQLTEKNIETTSPKSKENLKIIDGESDKLQSLIENILDYARIEKGVMMYDMKMIEIKEVILKAISSAQYQFRIQKQILESNIPDQQVYIYADSGAVERAVLNLLTNAAKYSPINAKTIISTDLNEEYYKIIVRDEGRGIPSAEMDLIFKPFSRAMEESSNKTKGTGLGLAIVKHIMDAHNGKIKVESEPGKGSTFTLLFPLMK